LRLTQRNPFGRKDRSRVEHSFIQPQTEEIVSQVVVGYRVFARPAYRVGRERPSQFRHQARSLPCQIALENRAERPYQIALNLDFPLSVTSCKSERWISPDLGESTACLD